MSLPSVCDVSLSKIDLPPGDLDRLHEHPVAATQFVEFHGIGSPVVQEDAFFKSGETQPLERRWLADLEVARGAPHLRLAMSGRSYRNLELPSDMRNHSPHRCHVNPE